MSILRIDAWQVKPGRISEVIEYAAAMKPLIEKHGGKSPRLMRIAVGGPSTGLIYGEFQIADLEEHGRVIGKLADDDEVMQRLGHFYRSDGPVESHEAAQVEVVAELGKRTESIPGCVELIRNFKIPNEQLDEYLDLLGQALALASQHDVRVRVLRGLTGSQTGNVAHVIEFADMAAFGHYASDIWPRPEFQELARKMSSVAKHTDGSLHAEIAT